MPLLGHEELYAASLEVTQQWLDTHKITHDPRHLQTALVCAAIARERYANVAKYRQQRRDNTDWLAYIKKRYAAVEAVVWGAVDIAAE
jgi:hypothetical protein